MKRYEFNKLIRNKIPSRMLDQGLKVKKKELNPDQYIEKLKEKLIEEANEVAAAQDINDIEIEIADVLEVIDALTQACVIKYENIENARLQKKSVNGTFDSDNYIDYIEVAEDNAKVIDYLDNKDRPYKLNI